MCLVVLFSLQECFRQNFITGRKLIAVNAQSMPHIGITKFEHISVSDNDGCYRSLLPSIIMSGSCGDESRGGNNTNPIHSNKIKCSFRAKALFNICMCIIYKLKKHISLLITSKCRKSDFTS